MTFDAPFKARFIFSDNENPIGRAYVHRAGLDDVFGSKEKVMKYFNQQYDVYLKEKFRDYDFSIAVLWGFLGSSKTKHKMIDVFGFHGLNRNWPGNPDVSNFVMDNGIFRPLEKTTDVTTCGDTIMLLGKEEEYRRRTQNLDFYLNHPPILDKLLNI